MSSYLVAVVVAWQYKSLESEPVQGGPITKVNSQQYVEKGRLNRCRREMLLMLKISIWQVWAPSKDVDAGRADYAALVGPPLIKFYEDTYGIK